MILCWNVQIGATEICRILQGAPVRELDVAALTLNQAVGLEAT